jgi:hypothetical protein
MDSVQLRRIVLPVIAVITGVFALYGTATGSFGGAAVLTVLAAVLASGVWAAERYRPHLQNLVQEKSYRITLRSVTATAVLTGVVLLAGLYAASIVIAVVAAFWGYEPVSFQIFADIVGRLALLLDLSLNALLGADLGVAVAMGVGFWVLYPYLPLQDETVAGPAAFLATWLYLLGAAAVLGDVPQSEPAAFAFDAAVAAVWGHLFAVAYQDIERYVP